MQQLCSYINYVIYSFLSTILWYFYGKQNGERYLSLALSHSYTSALNMICRHTPRGIHVLLLWYVMQSIREHARMLWCVMSTWFILSTASWWLGARLTLWIYHSFAISHQHIPGCPNKIDGLVQDCGIPSVLSLHWIYQSLVQLDSVNSLRPSDTYMRQWSNHHWFR